MLTTLRLVHPPLCQQGWLYYAVQVRYRACSPTSYSWCLWGEGRDSSSTLMTSEPALTPASALMGVRECLSPVHAASKQMRNRDSSPMLTTSGLAYPHVHQQGWLYCATWVREHATIIQICMSCLAGWLFVGFTSCVGNRKSSVSLGVA